jgi:hypothetical protein
LNASFSTDSDANEPQARELVGAIDIDPEALNVPALRVLDRISAGLAYLGPLVFLIAAAGPTTRFVRRHIHIAFFLFTVRTIWLVGILGAWWWRSEVEAGESRLSGFLFDSLFTVVIGVPVSGTLRTDALPWLLTPIIITLLAMTIGATLALTGKTADIQAFVSADWSEAHKVRSYLGISPEDERALARRARERQIERLQRSSRTLRTEQERRVRMMEVETQLERIDLQRDYHDQLLSLGEISQRRYDQVNEELDQQAAILRSQLSSLETRVQNAETSSRDQGNGSRLRRPSETLLESLAFVTPDGIPIFTYGQFQLDDAIVAGMLSAFDSLSEEVFGSRVSKTALAEGQVLLFAHGEYILAMASFLDEPSPRQVEDLRKMLKQFESANEGPISRKQYDPRYLHEVPLPFRIVERMSRPSN